MLPKRGSWVLFFSGCVSPEDFQEVEGYRAWAEDGYVYSVAMDAEYRVGVSVFISDVVGTEYAAPIAGWRPVRLVSGRRLHQTGGGCEHNPPGTVSRAWRVHSGVVELLLDKPEPDTTTVTVTLADLVVYDDEDESEVWDIGTFSWEAPIGSPHQPICDLGVGW